MKLSLLKSGDERAGAAELKAGEGRREAAAGKRGQAQLGGEVRGRREVFAPRHLLHLRGGAERLDRN